MALTSGAFATEVTYQYFRFVPINLRGGDNMIQLGEFEFYRGATEVTVPVGGVSNPGGSNEGTDSNEKAEKAIDGDQTTKWLDGNKKPLVFAFAAPVTVDSYRFATGNDAPERDPVTWRLEGSSTGADGEWVPVDQRTNYVPPDAREIYVTPFTIVDGGAPIVESFQIDGYTPPGATERIDMDAGASYVILPNGSEVDVFVNVVPEENPSFGPPTVTSTPVIPDLSDYGVYPLTPANDSETTYTLTATNASLGNSPQASVKTITIRAAGGGTANYRYIRFTATKLKAVGWPIQLDEFEFFNSGTEVIPTAVTNPGGSNAVTAGEGGNNLINNATDVVDTGTGTVTHRKWLDGNIAPVVFDFGSAKAFNSYRITTGNDWEQRDPIRWKLEGSNDNTTWALVDTVTNYDYPTPSDRWATFDIPLLPATSLAPAVTFTGDHSTLTPGQPLVLTWSVLNATSISISDGTTTQSGLAGSGTLSFNPTVPTTYTLTATSTQGITTTAQVQMSGFVGPDVVFAADANEVVAGQPVTLTWIVGYAASVTLADGNGTPVAVNVAGGNLNFTPTETTTYTLTATSGVFGTSGPLTTTRTVTVGTIPAPAITTIAYDDFDDADSELVLLRSTVIVNAFDRTPLPANAERLRLTDEVGGQFGEAWFRFKQPVATGFDTTFGLHLTKVDASTWGGDGVCFVVHNRPDGLTAFADGENGISINALNLKFDTFPNGAAAGDLGAPYSTIQLRKGTQIIRSVGVDRVGPEGTLLNSPQAGWRSLTAPTTSAPYTVRVVYKPGDLDVYLNSVLIIDSEPVNLADYGAIDASGKAYVGFSARTGGYFSANEITSWHLTTSGAPASLVLTASTINAAAGTGSFSWISTAGKEYRITASSDLVSWSTILAQDIPATGTATTKAFTFTPGTKGFFRVEEE